MATDSDIEAFISILVGMIIFKASTYVTQVETFLKQYYYYVLGGAVIIFFYRKKIASFIRKPVGGN